MHLSGRICLWTGQKKAFERRILNGLAGSGDLNARPFCFWKCHTLGFRPGWSHVIHFHIILFRALISHDHLPAFFYSYLRLNSTGAQLDTACWNFRSREKNTWKKNPSTSLANRHFQPGAGLKVLRTIETFLPYICGPANQAFQISQRLEEEGISSPVYTTYSDIPPDLPQSEKIGRVTVHRFKSQLKIMRYIISAGMLSHLKDFDILHSHNYRNFQTDSSFFLRS